MADDKRTLDLDAVSALQTTDEIDIVQNVSTIPVDRHSPLSTLLAWIVAQFTLATTTVKGIASFNTTDFTVSSGAVTIKSMSDTIAGKVEAATIAETNNGTDATRAVTPDGLAGSNLGSVRVNIALNGSVALTTSDRAKFRIPASMNGMNLVSVAANCGTDGSAGSSSSGVPTFTVQNGTTNMLSTNITIDANEYDTSTAATAAVIDTGHDDVATGNIINIETTVSGTGVTYVLITLEFQLP